MGERAWLYLLFAALSVHVALSGADQVAELRRLALSGERGGQWLLAVAGLVALAAVVVVSLVIARRLLDTRRRLVLQTEAHQGAEGMSSEWLWETDLDGRLTYSSEGVQTLLGRSPDSVVGTVELDLLHDAVSRAWGDRMLVERQQARSGWHDVELSWRHRDGTPVRLQGSGMPVRDAAGQVIGFRGARRLATPRAASGAPGERSRLEDFLATPDLTMALQPLVDLTDGRVVGVEALARFQDGRGPDQWFREAQACGLGHQLDALAFETALALFDELPPDVFLSVNAGPELLLDPRFRRALQRSGLPLHRLVIEITEHAAVADYAALNRAIDALREHRVRFAVDDTGAGYASFNHVLQIRPDVVKLDRGLITGVESDPARRSLVTALVLLALELGASVTGEGVETLGQLEALETLGVDHGQGYLLARPTTDRAQWATWWAKRTLVARSVV